MMKRSISASAGKAGGAMLLLAVALSGCQQGTPLAGGTLDRVLKSGVVRIGIRGDAPPFGKLYVDHESKSYFDGFDVRIAQQIVKHLSENCAPRLQGRSLKVQFVQVTSKNRIEKLLRDEVDLVVATMTANRQREEKVDFTIPYFLDHQRLLVKKGSAVKTYQDLAGKRVAAVTGSTALETIRIRQPEARIVQYPDYDAAVDGVVAGEVEALVSDTVLLRGKALEAKKADKGELLVVGGPLSDEPYGIAVRENDSAWRDALNNALMDMWPDVWNALFDSFFGPQSEYALKTEFIMPVIPKG